MLSSEQLYKQVFISLEAEVWLREVFGEEYWIYSVSTAYSLHLFLLLQEVADYCFAPMLHVVNIQ